MNALTSAAVKTSLAGAATYAGYRAVTHALRTPYTFADKVCVVTGGSRGFGLLLARRVVEAGGKVAVCSRSESDVRHAADELAVRAGHRAGKRVLGMTCDVTDRGEVDRFVKAVREELGPVDLLVNNAGLISFGPQANFTPDDYEQSLATHFWGPYHTTQACLPDLRRRRGRILNVASIGGLVGLPHASAYSAGKFALVGYSESLRAELAPHGVLVTTACPGLMRTGSPRHAVMKGRARAEYKWFKLGDSLPLISQDARVTADRVLATLRAGRPHVVPALPVAAFAAFHGVCRSFSLDLLGLATRALPAPTDSNEGHRGYQVESGLTRSFLTKLTQRAAVRNNEV